MAVDPKVVQELFAAAIAMTDLTERDCFLVNRCVGNDELHARINKLIGAYDGGAGLLESPTNPFAATMMHAAINYQPGHIIAGRFKLLESIGEGGMGSVWVAEQMQPVRRKVAIKLVKPGMDSKQVLARFDAERQALALMDHPNIARVFDGGVTEQGRPFFVMEYVKGMPLTDYCDQMRLPMEERLRLFVPICQAVQHAHQKGIIHRDLKPSNVLICLYDGKPVPKVIDFGLAKAMHQPLTEQTVHTGHGLMIGTPLYMSPEQAEHNNLDVDTRTDIYSLGVMLYELLTGSTPLEKAQFKDAAFGEILRLIKEVEPPKPSTRVSSSANLPTIAAQRNLDSKQLGRCIRGDLDWIVMKAIEKERGRRYDTANGLARDIERFLNLEAVEACPPSTSYRLRRLARKYRAVLGTAAAFAVLLVLGTGLSVWQALRATKAESLASQRLVDVQVEQHKTREALEASQQSERRAMDMESQATAKSKALQTLTEEQRRIIYASEMNQVRLEAQRGNLARMREILLEQLPIDGKEDLRGFEWNYWYRYINQANVVRKFDNATSDTWGSALVRVVPGGRQVAWTHGKNTALVDLESGTSRTLPVQLRHYVDRTPISDNGRILVGACLSHTYPVGTYKPPGTNQGSSTSCSVIEPTGQVQTFDYPKDSFKHISALNISRDGSLIAVIGYDVYHSAESPATRICVWNVDAKQLVLNKVYPREINRISFSPDSQKLAAHLCHGTKRNSDVFREVAVIIDLATTEEIAILENDDDIDSLFWIPGADRVLLSTLGFSGANRKQLVSWPTKETRARPGLLSRESMPDYVNGVVSPDGSMLAITSHTVQQIRLFDTSHGDLIDTLQTDGKGIVSLTFSADDRQLTATTVNGELLRWELGKDRDLFALRTKPLPRLARSGFALSPDQSLLGIVLIDGTVLVRTREGDETILKMGIPKATVGSSLVRISGNNELLAVMTNAGPDGKALASGKGMLEVYDLIKKQRLWQTGQISIANESSLFGSTLEFSADGQKLVQVADTCYVYHARSGKGYVLDPRENRTTSRGTMRLQRNPQSGALVCSFAERKADRSIRTVIVDPTNGTELCVSTDELSGSLLGIAPDGKHCWSFPGAGVQVWNMATGERLFSAPGLFAVFSLDSQRVAILTRLKPNPPLISGVAIWDLPSRRKICELPLAGETIDEVRFSPDGKRLLTIEGRILTNSQSKPACGRLWDLETGREILDLRVAEVNHYDWELYFDDAGQILTQLLFNKATATIGGGTTAIYDAKPLEPAVDCQLAANRLIYELASRFALKKEWIAEIESRAGLKAGIRHAALAKVGEVVITGDQVAKLTAEIVAYPERSQQRDYERALLYAKELNDMEPNTHRSRTLLGATYYRLNRYEDALRTLTTEETAETSPIPETELSYDNLRRVVLAMVQYQMGKKQDAISSLLGLKTAPSPELYAIALMTEAGALIRPPKPIRPTAPESMPTEDGLEKRVQGFITIYGNPDLELSKLPANSGYRLMNYDTNQDHRLDQKETLVAFRDMYRFGQPIVKADWLSSVEANLEFLDEAIRDAPQYMTPRFVRAWIRATCADSQYRDPKKALDEAGFLCEQTKHQDATFLEALAAAHAASNDFLSAIRWQSEAARIYRENGTFFTDNVLREAQSRLKAYENKQMFDPKLPDPNDLIVRRTSSQSLRERNVSVPYLSPQVVFNSKRIDGFGAAWSPDDKKIARSIKSEGSRRTLEWIELASGMTQRICEDGVYPVWTATPTERIYFSKLPPGRVLNPFVASIWYCDSDGKNVTRLMEGSSPAVLKDGTLLVKTTSLKGSIKTTFRGFQNDPSGALVETGQHYAMEAIGELSPDGKLAAETAGNLIIREIESKKAIRTLDLESLGLGSSVAGAWSPDSRFYAYSSMGKANTGLWVLDVNTGATRLLADLDAANQSWSHDGRFLAASERGKEKIVILDVSSLHGENDLSNAPQQ